MVIMGKNGSSQLGSLFADANGMEYSFTAIRTVAVTIIRIKSAEARSVCEPEFINLQLTHKLLLFLVLDSGSLLTSTNFISANLIGAQHKNT